MIAPDWKYVARVALGALLAGAAGGIALGAFGASVWLIGSDPAWPVWLGVGVCVLAAANLGSLAVAAWYALPGHPSWRRSFYHAPPFLGLGVWLSWVAYQTGSPDLAAAVACLSLGWMLPAWGAADDAVTAVIDLDIATGKLALAKLRAAAHSRRGVLFNN